MSQKCKNHPNRFCYICRHVLFLESQAKITDFMKKAYQAYFGVKLGDQDMLFASHIRFKAYVENLWDWKNKKRKSMQLDVPMVWREGKDHVTDCYFCTNLKGTNRKNKHYAQYPDVSSEIKPVPHGPDLPVSESNVTMESSSDSKSSDTTDTAESDAYRPEEDDQPVPLTQAELNDLRRDLNFSKEPVQLLRLCLLVFERNFFSHLEQHSTGIGNARENLDIYSRLMKHLHWSTVTIFLTWLNYMVWRMML